MSELNIMFYTIIIILLLTQYMNNKEFSWIIIIIMPFLLTCVHFVIGLSAVKFVRK
jgi:sugar phosphate permease